MAVLALLVMEFNVILHRLSLVVLYFVDSPCLRKLITGYFAEVIFPLWGINY